MRLPNGFGSVYKLSGKRRKPYIARKTIGWDDEGKQKYLTIGYFQTKKEAIEALTEYNKNPYGFEVSTITFAEVFEEWKKQKYNKISKSAINGYNAAFDTSEKLHNMKFVEIKTVHLQDVIDTCGKGYGSLRKLKVLFNQLFKFAMQNDIVSKDYSKYAEISQYKDKETKIKRVPFTADEIQRLFDVSEEIEYVDAILILIYTGMRIGELLELEIKNVDLENRTITGGKKTDAGKDRIIPIHDKIYNFVENNVNKNKKYLIENNGNAMKYDNFYKDHFLCIMEQLRMTHTPHDCRHTTATLLSNAGANQTSSKLILGHSSYTITEKFYTHKDIEELKKAISLI